MIRAISALLLTCVAVPAQEAENWNALVAKACEHQRYGMRVAVATKIGKAGDAAVDAVRAYAADKTLPLLLVDAIASADGDGPKTLALLGEWAQDRTFYWRAQALRGLADRKHRASVELFRTALHDASFLFRIEGARGLYLTDADRAPARALLRDADPRARARIAAFLLEQKDAAGLATAAAALRRRDTFLGDPWAEREATTALRALRAFAGDDFGYDVSAPPAANAAALGRIDALVLSHGGEAPPPSPSVSDDYAGGVEIRSCRSGDLFLRWTSDGRIDFGLEASERTGLPAATWNELAATLPTDAEDRTHGTVVCDYLRVLSTKPTLRAKCAPGALPDDLTRWLKALAAGLEKTGEGDLAAELTSRLDQFVPASRN